MVAFNRINVGDVFYDCRMQKQGNTTLRQMACWPVRIVSIDSVKGTAMASWNGNAPRLYGESSIKRLRRTKIGAPQQMAATTC